MAEAEAEDIYVLGAGDQLKINVYNESDLSGEYDVDGVGRLSLPLLGQLEVAGKSLDSVTDMITKQYADGYLVNPKITVEIMNFRHFFIVGEVKNPGSYPYKNALTVINAVALAGGFTPRANQDEVLVFRKDTGGDSKELELKEGAKILPGDTIRVKERFF